MLDKGYLEKMILSTFPDIYNTKFEINNQRISLFTEGKLLPFLVYQNTVDLNHRLIGLFLSDKTSGSHLIPFYILMGQLRKALKTVMQIEGFQNQSYHPNEVQIIFNATIGYVSSVDFINRQLILRFGMGNERKVPFSTSYNIKTYNPNSELLFNKLFEFEKIDKADKTNIFTFPITPNNNQYEGVIIFTNTSKFESLIRSIKVSGDDLRSRVNVEKVIFPINGYGHNFIRISGAHTSNKPVSVLVARQDAFMAYHSILASGEKRLSHIKTIVIDDFDELIMKWEKSNKLDDILNTLKEIYFNPLKERKIKDVYLICRNSSLNVHDVLKKLEIDYHPWLVNPLEAECLNEEINSSPQITFTNVDDANFENLNNDINDLLLRWKNLAETNYCNGEIITPIKFLYDLRARLNSFFNPEGLKSFFTIFLERLVSLKNKWFFAGQDYNLISETKKLINKCTDTDNFKLKIIIEILKNRTTKNLSIVSDNNNDDDKAWFENSIHFSFPDINIIHSHRKSSFQLKNEEDDILEIIIYLISDKKIIGKSLGNILASKQIFILNNKEYSFTANYSKNYQRLQIEIGR